MRTGGPGSCGRVERENAKRVAAALTSFSLTFSDSRNATNKPTNSSKAVRVLALCWITNDLYSDALTTGFPSKSGSGGNVRNRVFSRDARA